MELERALAVAKNVLTNRLTKMVAMGNVEKRSLADSRDWSEYHLTAKGWALFPVINTLMAWGDTYAAPNGPPLVLIHKCGHPAGHRVVCQCCGEDLVSKDVHVQDGPD